MELALDLRDLETHRNGAELLFIPHRIPDQSHYRS